MGPTTTHVLELVLGLTSLAVLIILVPVVYFCRRRSAGGEVSDNDVEKSEIGDGGGTELVDWVTFRGGEDLTVSDILEAPGEVIGKSGTGTVYKAVLRRVDSVLLLRFLRPVCTGKVSDFSGLIRVLGEIRHPNLVPLLGFYGGSRGEKLLVYPYYKHGNLAHFIQDGKGESRKWNTIHRIAIGIAKALDHIHARLANPMIHANLSSKTVFLDQNSDPRVSDFGLYFLLNPNAAWEMLASDGCKPPELIEVKEATQSTDVYSLGVVLLELLVIEKGALLVGNAGFGCEVGELFHPEIVVDERVVELFWLAMACCARYPSSRPGMKEVLSRMDEIGR